ncbi:MAG: 2-phosphosulfolactate phosphatase [Clostridia bacterium]|nr:2-phosphosulfolactate phosphatase [Clostridia bacterium]
MNIRTLHMIEGAREARGIAVIIDVFRAFSTEAYLLARGAKKVIPVGEESLARRLKAEIPDVILAGERRGKILPGFDMGNSPAQAEALDVVGKTVIHTTSAGTQGIANAIHADEILGGSLVTARAIADYIRTSGATEVSLVAMGLDAVSETEEDTLCADYIRALLEGRELDMESEVEKLKTTSGAKFFDPAQNDVFPEADFHMCVAVDKFDFVLRLVKPKDGLPYMEEVRPLR